jgi:hypothetical protein
MYLFSLGLGGWLLLLETLYLHLIRHSWFPSQGVSAIFATSLYALTTVLFYYIFIVKDRDQQIFGKYEELANQNPKRKGHLIISVSILVMPYIALLSFAVFFHGHMR